MYLTDEDIKYFIGRLNGLSKADKIALKRAIGQDLDRQPAGVKMALAYCVPDKVIDDTTLRNLFFVACVFCSTDNASNAEGRNAENVVAESILKKHKNDANISENRFSEILGLRTGAGTRLYKDLGEELYKYDGKINCFGLIRDLENWDGTDERYLDSVQKKWASAYIRTINVNELAKEGN